MIRGRRSFVPNRRIAVSCLSEVPLRWIHHAQRKVLPGCGFIARERRGGEGHRSRSFGLGCIFLPAVGCYGFLAGCFARPTTLILHSIRVGVTAR